MRTSHNAHTCIMSYSMQSLKTPKPTKIFKVSFSNSRYHFSNLVRPPENHQYIPSGLGAIVLCNYNHKFDLMSCTVTVQTPLTILLYYRPVVINDMRTYRQAHVQREVMSIQQFVVVWSRLLLHITSAFPSQPSLSFGNYMPSCVEFLFFTYTYFIVFIKVCMCFQFFFSFQFIDSVTFPVKVQSHYKYIIPKLQGANWIVCL